MIKAAVNMPGNCTSGTMSSSIDEFCFVKAFNVQIHPPKAQKIIEVIWQPPLSGWFKCNVDGAATQEHAACGGIFRDSRGAVLGCFSEYIGAVSSMEAELCGAMFSIEIAYHQNWLCIWLETDSKLVVQAFTNEDIVPWKLKSRWLNCKLLCCKMKFIFSHVYREGNSCTDGLANYGLSQLLYLVGSCSSFYCRSFL